jgi:hypothetical protein
MKLLVEANADINAVSGTWESPLDNQDRDLYRDREMREYLVGRGALKGYEIRRRDPSWTGSTSYLTWYHLESDLILDLEASAKPPAPPEGPTRRREVQKTVGSPMRTVTRPSASCDLVVGSPPRAAATPSWGSPMQFVYHSISAASESRLFRSLFMGYSASSISSSWARNRMEVDGRAEVPKPSVANNGNLSQTPEMQEMIM